MPAPKNTPKTPTEAVIVDPITPDVEPGTPVTANGEKVGEVTHADPESGTVSIVITDDAMNEQLLESVADPLSIYVNEPNNPEVNLVEDVLEALTLSDVANLLIDLVGREFRLEERANVKFKEVSISRQGVIRAVFTDHSAGSRRVELDPSLVTVEVPK